MDKEKILLWETDEEDNKKRSFGVLMRLFVWSV